MKECKNWIPEVMKMLGVNNEDEINLYYGDDEMPCSFNPFKFKNNRFVDKDGVNDEDSLSDILVGDCSYEIVRPLLTSKEKTYLKNVVSPFRTKVDYVVKELSMVNDCYYYVLSIIFGDEILVFPKFPVESDMYNNLQPNKRYALEELEIFED